MQINLNDISCKKMLNKMHPMASNCNVVQQTHVVLISIKAETNCQTAHLPFDVEVNKWFHQLFYNNQQQQHTCIPS